MKSGVFLFVVVAFAILSLFVFYLDSSKDCGTPYCIANYVSTGGEVKTSSGYELTDSLFSEIIRPFVSDENVGLGPSGGGEEAPCNDVTYRGVTFTFSGGPYTCGSFANGDPYVIGPVTVTSITPDFAGGRNGFQINPTSFNQQGYDSRSSDYNAALVPTLPLPVNSDSSIIKVISNDASAICENNPGQVCFVDDISVLTVLLTPPPANSFRPPFFGTQKTIYSADNLQTQLLPSLTPPTGVTIPTLSSVESNFEGPYLDYPKAGFGNLHPDKYMQSYSADLAIDTGEGVLRVMLDDSLSAKMPALINLVQTGIDYHELISLGADWSNLGGGGHENGRPALVALAGELLNNQQMKDAVANSGLLVFGENSIAVLGTGVAASTPLASQQIQFCNPSTYWNVLRNGQAAVGSQTCYDPYRKIDGNTPLGAYHQTFSDSAVPGVLAILLLPAGNTIWTNTVSVDYLKRWVEFGAWTQLDNCAPAPGVCFVGGNPTADLCSSADAVYDLGTEAVTYPCGAGGICNLSTNGVWPDPDYGVTYGDNGGVCISDTNSLDGTGRYPNLHLAGHPINHPYKSPFADAMWTDYISYTDGPVIDTISPNPITNEADKTVTLTGAVFMPNFAIGIRVTETTGWNIHCSSIVNPLDCIFVDSNEVTFRIPAGYSPGTFDIEYVDLSNIALPVESINFVSLDIELPPPVPAAPSGLTATVLSNSEIRLDWTDNSGDETGFRIEKRSPAGQGVFSTAGTVASSPGTTGTFTENTLSAQTSYDYRVYAYNVAGDSLNPSNIVSATTWPNPPVLTSLTPSSVAHYQDQTITLIGSNFNPNSQAGIKIRDVGGTTFIDWCPFYATPNTPPHYCNRLSSTEFTFVMPQGNPPGPFEVAYVNIDSFSPVMLQETVFRPLTVTATTCLDGQTQQCPLQQGVCQNSFETCIGGNWPGCDYGPNYATNEAGLCTDGFDNDCDELTEGRDYDGAGTIHGGDAQCTVSMNTINVVPSNPFVSSNFDVDCTPSVSNINSVVASIDLNPGACTFDNWFGSIARFDCVSSPTPATQNAQCTINLTKSYMTGPPANAPVTVISNDCAVYTSQGSNVCENVPGNLCDWCPGCSGPNTILSNGNGNNCVMAGTCDSGSYMCRATGIPATSCGATCDGTSSLCGPSAVCNTNPLVPANLCGCVEQTPQITGAPLSIVWSSSTSGTVTGNSFANNAELLVDNILVAQGSVSGVISFTYNAGQFNLGTPFNSGVHQFKVRNPTSTLESGTSTFTLTSTPTITSIPQSPILNNIDNLINIIGTDLNPRRVWLFGTIELSPLWTAISPNQVNLFVPAGLDGAYYPLTVENWDGTISNSNTPFDLRIDYPFNYTMNLNPQNYLVIQGSTDLVTVTLAHGYGQFVTPEPVALTVNSPFATAIFPGGNTCTPSPTCTIIMNITAFAGVLAGQQYLVDIEGTSASTLLHSATLTLNGTSGSINDCTDTIQNPHETCFNGGGPICRPAGYLCDFGESCLSEADCFDNPLGEELCYNNLICALDDDDDQVPNGPAGLTPNINLDLCPGTLLGATLSPLMLGCPVPMHSFTPTLSTDFMSTPNLSAVANMSLGRAGLGKVDFLEDVSVMRNYQPMDLDEAVIIEDDLVGVDSVSYPELNERAVVTMYNLPYTSAPNPMIVNGGVMSICPATICQLDSFNIATGDFVLTVNEFSNYSTNQSTCGDNYCNILSETCTSCVSDCGACPGPGTPGGSPGGGSPGGGGSGGPNPPRTPVVPKTQCSDGIDNDGDGKTDYPVDTGCSNRTDNIELNVENLITPPSDEETPDEDQPVEKDIEISIIFWTVLTLLIAGIIVAGVMIAISIGRRKKFEEIAQIVNNKSEDNTSQDNNNPSPISTGF